MTVFWRFLLSSRYTMLMFRKDLESSIGNSRKRKSPEPKNEDGADSSHEPANKKSKAMAEVDGASETAITSRGRGRPRKAAVEASKADNAAPSSEKHGTAKSALLRKRTRKSADDDAGSMPPPQTPGKRGRPRKASTATDAPPEQKDLAPSPSSSVKRGPGRPPPHRSCRFQAPCGDHPITRQRPHLKKQNGRCI